MLVTGFAIISFRDSTQTFQYSEPSGSASIPWGTSDRATLRVNRPVHAVTNELPFSMHVTGDLPSISIDKTMENPLKPMVDFCMCAAAGLVSLAVIDLLRSLFT
jgi:hypothetical protein